MARYYTNGNKVDDAYKNDLAQWKTFGLQKANQDIASDPKNVDAYKLRANIYRSNNQNQLALEDLKKAIETEPKNSDLYFEQGLAYWGLGSKYDAEIAFSKAIELNSGNANYYFYRSLVIDPVYDTKKIADLTKAIELEPQRADFYFNRAQVYFTRTYPKSHLEALNDYDKVIELSKDLANSAESGQFNVIASIQESDMVLAKLGDEFFNKKIEQNPNNAYYYILRAKYYEKFWDLRDPESSTAKVFNISKYWKIIRENQFINATNDYLKCAEISIEKKEFCLNAAANFKSKIEAYEARRKQEKKEKRSQAFLEVMGAVTQTLETYNSAKRNTPTPQTPQTTTPSRPQTTQTAGTSNATTGITVSDCNDGIQRGGTGFDCHQFVTSGHTVSDSVLRATYWDEVCNPGDYCSQWGSTSLPGVLWRGVMKKSKTAADKPYVWTIGFKNTSNAVVVAYPELVYADGTTQPGQGGVALTPGSEAVWHVTWGTTSATPPTLRFYKYAICTNISRTSDGYQCN